jgi:hypothetical protein
VLYACVSVRVFLSALKPLESPLTTHTFVTQRNPSLPHVNQLDTSHKYIKQLK